MTSERLERLREWVKASAGSEVAFVYSDGILRLLDEREALLEAARKAQASMDSLEHWSQMDVQTELEAAIAKAESP